MKLSDDVNFQSWSEQLYKIMMNADRQGASDLISLSMTKGLSSEQIIVKLLDPALVKLGILWEKESVSLAQTFVAAKIAEDILLRCVPEVSMAHNNPVVIGNIEDDFHSLGRRIVATFLRASGWNVYDIGNDVPAEDFVDKALEVGAVVIGASAMMQTTALNIRKLREVIDSRGLRGRIKLAVGGAVFNWRPDLVAEVGGDGTANNAIGANALFLKLQAEAKGALIQ